MNPMEALRNALGPAGDSTFWSDVASNATNPSQIADTLAGYGMDAIKLAARPIMKPAYRASKLSQDVFPNQEWDNSQRNALRHSAWIGGLAQAMGASPDNPIRTPIAQTIAKGLGYGHELVSALDDYRTGKVAGPAQKRDTLHDLNNNAIGAEMAGHTRNNEDLYRALAAMAVNARMGEPVGRFSMSDGRLSADQEASPKGKPLPFLTGG